MTVGLAAILKDEIHNIDTFLSSVKGCFDGIWLCDTGSTDGSLELLQKYAAGPNPAETPIYLSHFEWCDDFSKARNASFEPVTTDYVCWMDLDDSMQNPEMFAQWRDELMHIGNYWMATYHYAHNQEGKPICSFARERVVKRTLGLKWESFVHEGISLREPKEPVTTNFATSWSIKHRRTVEDLSKDQGRNLRLFEKHKDTLDIRMKYYYGKELFENKRGAEAMPYLLDSVSDKDLQTHDRILGIQYAALCALSLDKPAEAMQLAYQGLVLDPNRAEFFLAVGESLMKMRKLREAIPYFKAATACPYAQTENRTTGAIYAMEAAHTIWPRHHMARCYFEMGELDNALTVLDECRAFGRNADTDTLWNEVTKIKHKTSVPKPGTAIKRDEILISCTPTGPYEWDERIAQEVGIGGSEIAVVKMARALRDITGRRVLIYNNRDSAIEFDGVEYRPCQDIGDYIQKYEPHVHIAWRHVSKLTEAPTYIWCHDLMAMGIEHHSIYHRVLALSPFHKGFLKHLFAIPEEKIVVTRNGIDTSRWDGPAPQRDPFKVVYTSSPDRGLDRVIQVMDKVVKEVPQASLNVYYGFDNMVKIGKQAEVDWFMEQIKSRPWITLRGNVEQVQLVRELRGAGVWLYPTNFNETFCISALEAVFSGVWPVVRSYGALPDTLRGLPGTVIDMDCITESEVLAYTDATISAMLRPMDMTLSPQIMSHHDWKAVAAEWVQLMNL